MGRLAGRGFHAGALARRPAGPAAAVFARACGSVNKEKPTIDGKVMEGKPPFRKIRTPTIEECQAAPQSIAEVSDPMLMLMAEQADHGACEERLRRNVMAVDQVDYEGAEKKMEAIKTQCFKRMTLSTLPYKVGVVGGVASAIVCVPFVFHKGTALWFNDIYVTGDVPPPEDLETFYEVGSWTWGWMEPVMGTLSFSLLAFQVVRAQMENMDLKLYTDMVKVRRSNRLQAAFPTYNPHFVADYARTASMHGP